MLEHSILIGTTRENEKVIVTALTLTDFNHRTNFIDIAVDEEYHNIGIGKKLTGLPKLASPKGKLIIKSAPKTVNYYLKIGNNA